MKDVFEAREEMEPEENSGQGVIDSTPLSNTSPASIFFL
jgi:hypothetical protein